MPSFFQIRHLDVEIASTSILRDISLDFHDGEVTALLGHNGSGKSTLLKVLARQLEPSGGELALQGSAFGTLGQRDFARQVGFLPQYTPATDGLTVRELVALGRYPWKGPLGRYRDEDQRLIDQAIDDTGLQAFAQRSVDTLSGGERQRAWIAMLLAQQTRCLLLDEPISALDVLHQVETLRLIQRLAEQRELTVVMVLHDVDLAARFCDRLVALKAGAVTADGTPAQIMNEQVLESIYSVPMGVMERAPGQWVSYVH
ncbi:ABC transporter ATP-binding protein [Marinobacter xestospongiae]|uniref:ATP-binding cassette domain-containing protein n=1 Tax=Marinobacter xestospongiae TaxID=994319 RepID=A0ABU3VSN2_9GAMM|nr:ATP-binding cassette domain-containing protein [Marinobacter xestospongiae]MDV2077221.1 ATP-binding cassette domain-containing protein [Marinobacter xestospongiae]